MVYYRAQQQRIQLMLKPRKAQNTNITHIYRFLRCKELIRKTNQTQNTSSMVKWANRHLPVFYHIEKKFDDWILFVKSTLKVEKWVYPLILVLICSYRVSTYLYVYFFLMRKCWFPRVLHLQNRYIVDDYLPQDPKTPLLKDMVFALVKDENLVLAGYLERFFERKDETWINIAMVLTKDMLQLIKTHDDCEYIIIMHCIK